ncbi:MAG: L-serine ammonia-lyase, iron-sulfur-dependent, subunit alpha [Lachnospiraceae bacterium]|jgi:L-serine dehydratase|nr:L-serine ammonia-lyase, iron-sulfur-dependent, subunit alpha [Lachnospiraceae bacterium]
MAFHSLEQICRLCREENKDFYHVILEDDMKEREVSEEGSRSKMKKMWRAMVRAAEDYDPALRSASGLSGCDGGRAAAYYEAGGSLCGEFIGEVVTGAIQMAESNACMRRIVAAPTAGSCGVLPAVLLPCQKKFAISDDRIVEALYVAAGIGQVIASRAFIAGATGGCQAEIGSASAMAAGALVFLRGGDAGQICDGAAIALKALMGLVCDPVAGLVEVPCVKRNVIGAVGAMTAADQALAGIRSFIPADQVIDAMREVGEKMDASLRETGLGGLAATAKGESVRLES